jgi:hypothetical protein
MIFGTPKKDVWFPKGSRFHSLRTAALEDLILCVIYGLSLHYLVIHKNNAHLPPPPGQRDRSLEVTTHYLVMLRKSFTLLMCVDIHDLVLTTLKPNGNCMYQLLQQLVTPFCIRGFV